MAATGQPDSDAVELAVIRAQRINRHRAAQFRKRSGSFFRIHHGRGSSSNPNSVVHGLAAAASATYVCKALGCSALVDAGRARASAADARRTWFHCSDGCANNGCAKRFRAVRFKARQLAMADALDNGSRWLADWPADIGYGVGQRRGSAAARLAGAAIVCVQYLCDRVYDTWPDLTNLLSALTPLPKPRKRNSVRPSGK